MQIGGSMSDKTQVNLKISADLVRRLIKHASTSNGRDRGSQSER